MSIIITKTTGAQNAAELHHRNDHPDYEFYSRQLIPRRPGGKTVAALYHIPPRKSNFPYHYHVVNEESFYIISGRGLLKTPEGDRAVEAGDFVFMPNGAEGAHKLTNSSDTETLVYIDFDSACELEVAVYPDSDKVGIWGGGLRELYERKDTADYYKGE